MGKQILTQQANIKKTQLFFAYLIRFLIYLIIGYLIYYFLNPPKIFNVPFSELTILSVLQNLIVFFSLIYLLNKFLQFPEKEDWFIIKMWVKVGGISIIISIILFAYYKSSQIEKIENQKVTPEIQELRNKYNY